VLRRFVAGITAYIVDADPGRSVRRAVAVVIGVFDLIQLGARDSARYIVGIAHAGS